VPDPVRARLRGWTAAVKIVVTVTVLVVLFSRVNPRAVVRAWAGVHPGWALAALVLVMPNLACQYGRVRVGLMRAHPGAGAIVTLRALLVGLAMGAVTPGRVGELGSAMFLPRGGRRRALGVLAVMRIYGFSTTVALGSVMWALEPGLIGLSLPTTRTLASLALAIVALIVAAGELVFRPSRQPWAERLSRRLRGGEDVFLGMKALHASDRAWFGVWSVGLSVIYLSQLVLLVRAFGGEVMWAEGIAAGAVTTGIVALLPIAVGNIGVRESAAILVWQHLGVPAPVAFNAAFALFLTNAVLPGVAGLAWNALAERSTGAGRP